MIVEIRCICGQSMSIDSTRAGPKVICPNCNRPHIVPSIVDYEDESGAEKGRSNPSWIPVTGSALAVVLICASLLWALTLFGGGSGAGGGDGMAMTADGPGGSDNGDDPYAGRFNRGVRPGSTKPGTGTDGGADSRPSGVKTPRQEVAIKPDINNPDTPPVRPPDDFGPIDVDPPKHDPPDDPDPPSGANVVAGSYEKRGQRGGGDFARKMGATKESEAAVDLGLEWLAKVQLEDGHWEDGVTVAGLAQAQAAQKGEGNPRVRRARARYSVGYTSLATLAFLGAGHTHTGKGKYAKTVQKALDWLIKHQDPMGKFSISRFYEQGLATMVLCEAYGMTKDKRLRVPAQKAVDCIALNMGPNGGYGYGGPGDDTHVTSFQVMGLKSGKLAKLQVPKKTFDKLKAYYNGALGKDGTTGYSANAGRGRPRATRTAVGLFCRMFLDCGSKTPKSELIAEVLHEVGPQVSNVFQTYNGTYAMFQMGGVYWKRWNEKFRDPVIKLQIKEGLEKGSWPKLSAWGGELLSTSINIMSLEVYYRYLPVNK